MRNILIICTLVITSTLYAQESNQNPNAQVAYKKYAKTADSYILKQGTTAQETYVAIDPMEERRIRRKLHKDQRANRSLWRHQERMERAKHTRYRSSFYGGNMGYGNLGYGNMGYGNIGSPFYNNWGWGLGTGLSLFGGLRF